LTTRRIVAYIICLIAVAVGLHTGLPSVGIPRAQLLPPAVVYADAKGRTTGRVTGKPTSPTANPFRVGTTWYFIEYAFSAPAPQMIGEANPGKPKRYTGQTRVEKGIYDAVNPGQPVRVRYETTYPVINGIDAPERQGGGRSGAPGSALVSIWILWTLATLFLAYLLLSAISPFLKQENI
jgi:hypothetical protein